MVGWLLSIFAGLGIFVFPGLGWHWARHASDEVDIRTLALSSVLTSWVLSPVFFFIWFHFVPVKPLLAGLGGLLWGLTLYFFQRQKDRPFQLLSQNLSQGASVQEPDPACEAIPLPSSSVLIWVLLATGFVMFWVGTQMYVSGEELAFIPANGDWPKHDVLIRALSGQKLPIANPFFYPTQRVDLSYYYAFHLMPAALLKANASNGFWVYLFSASLLAFSIMTILTGLLERLGGRRGALAGVFFLLFLMDLQFVGSVSALWSHDSQAHLGIHQLMNIRGWVWLPSFLDSIITSPHHALGYLGLLLSVSTVFKSKSPQWTNALEPFALASVCMSTVYVGIVYTFVLVLKALWAFQRTSGIRTALSLKKALAWTGSLTALMFFVGTILPPESAQTSGMSVYFGLGGPKSWVDSGALGKILAAAARYALSFGFYVLVCWVGRATLKRNLGLEQLRFFWSLILLTLGLGLFLHSNGFYQDFTFRVFGFHRLIWVCLAALSVSALTFRWKVTLGLLALLSSVQPYWQHATLGPYRLLKQAKGNPLIVPKEYLEVADYLRTYTRATCRVQERPGKVSLMPSLSQRPSVLADHEHGGLFNVDQAVFWALWKRLTELFDQPMSQDTLIHLAGLGIDFVVVDARQDAMAALQPDLSDTLLARFQNARYAVYQVSNRNCLHPALSGTMSTDP